MASVQTCEHPACSCQVEDGQKYCGNGCKDASQNVAKNDLCDCGHDACQRKA